LRVEHATIGGSARLLGLSAASSGAGKAVAENIVATFPNCPITEIARLGPTLRQWKDTYLGYVTTDGANSGSTDAVGAGVDQVVRVDAEHAAGGSKGVDVVGLALTCPGGAAGRLDLPHVLTPLDPLACSASRSSRGIRGSATGAPAARGRSVVERCFNRLEELAGHRHEIRQGCMLHHAAICLAATLIWINTDLRNTPSSLALSWRA
jgi:hypothetical protein